jgi:hypothetical protein
MANRCPGSTSPATTSKGGITISNRDFGIPFTAASAYVFLKPHADEETTSIMTASVVLNW